MARDQIELEQPELGFPYPWYKSTDLTKIHRGTCRFAAAPFQHAATWSDARMRIYLRTLNHVTACKLCCRELEEDTDGES